MLNWHRTERVEWYREDSATSVTAAVVLRPSAKRPTDACHVRGGALAPLIATMTSAVVREYCLLGRRSALYEAGVVEAARSVDSTT
jgi:hypothetical protein|eukprot:CAMPEP_0181175452 /NCGR_PEP_ID=MMETSP1096-20121128/4087_1 /TAXON_ID=156174 ORGANISM="Chrysochromulina ericina, Strain CCMP281" /NCGR_SAMPLE_ID=MMETSP1096 /ASSEMBLY_ACC=CAM_ASM_000453 /LENGTH=85 /DNA_ID=CAMNT_0023263441 /DNA_START=374 /DNA_END=631 /DNA_ORIENTATION=+